MSAKVMAKVYAEAGASKINLRFVIYSYDNTNWFFCQMGHYDNVVKQKNPKFVEFFNRETNTWTPQTIASSNSSTNSQQKSVRATA